MVISILGLLFGFVRASWVGFFGGILFLSLFGPKVKLSKFRFNLSIKLLLFLFLFISTLIFLSPAFKNIIESRFVTKTPISTMSVRFVQAYKAVRLFLNHPIIGNGPGSFAILGVWGHAEEYYQQLVEKGKVNPEGRFDPCLYTTILEDTGIIGALLFLLLSLKFLSYNLRMIPKIDNHYQIISMSLLGGLIGLFISYVFTQGFWIPFTWVFLGFNIVSIRIGLGLKNEVSNAKRLS